MTVVCRRKPGCFTSEVTRSGTVRAATIAGEPAKTREEVAKEASDIELP